jgi:hypothetical protein
MHPVTGMNAMRINPEDVVEGGSVEIGDRLICLLGMGSNLVLVLTVFGGNRELDLSAYLSSLAFGQRSQSLTTVNLFNIM